MSDRAITAIALKVGSQEFPYLWCKSRRDAEADIFKLTLLFGNDASTLKKNRQFFSAESTLI